MKHFYGPYVRNTASDKWHWKEECPHYPKGLRTESMITSTTPDTQVMCDHCSMLDLNAAHDQFENVSSDNNIHHLTDKQISINKIISENFLQEQVSFQNSLNNKKQA